MKKTLDVRRNTDGTVTAIYGKARASFQIEPWYSEAEIIDRAKWELISLGVNIEHTEEARHGAEKE